MRLLCTILILACTATYVYAATAIFPPEPKPAEFARQEGCYLSSLNRVLPYNESFYPEGECLQYTCQISNYTQLVSCGVIGLDPKDPSCRIVKDPTQKYPNCCGKPVCDPTEPPAVEKTCDDNQ